MNEQSPSLKTLTIKYRAVASSIDDFDKCENYVLMANSAALHGLTLTAAEMSILFDLGLTANKKSLSDHLACMDLFDAYQLADKMIISGVGISPKALSDLNAVIVRHTGVERTGRGGMWDESKGDWRTDNVVGEDGLMHETRSNIRSFVSTFCTRMSESLFKSMSMDERYDLSFKAMYTLMSIYPWSLGSGRVARLVMYMIQKMGGLVPTVVFAEDKEELVKTLAISQQYHNIAPFINFMRSQLVKTLTVMPFKELAISRESYLKEYEKEKTRKRKNGKKSGTQQEQNLFSFMPEPEEKIDNLVIEDDSDVEQMPIMNIDDIDIEF